MSLRITVDSAHFERTMTGALDVIDRALSLASEDLGDQLQDEGGRYSSRLAEPWIVEGDGSSERHVKAPTFFAHFVAGGTAGHGPREKSRMRFINKSGETVFARFVKGVPPTHFDERALSSTRSALPGLLSRALEDVTP